MIIKNPWKERPLYSSIVQKINNFLWILNSLSYNTNVYKSFIAEK